MRGCREDPAEGIAQEGAAPKFQAVSWRGIAVHVAGLVSYTVYHSHVHTVGNGVSALNGAPGVMLRLAKLGFLGRMPPNGGGIEKYLCTLQCSQASAFGIPLVPANQRAHAADPGIEGPVAEIPGGEIVLLVVERVVGNVHLAI